jgi:hypothetical protein
VLQRERLEEVRATNERRPLALHAVGDADAVFRRAVANFPLYAANCKP